MKITHDDLKRAYKSHIRKRVPLSREACPSPESIYTIFDESAAPAAKEKLIDHITGCCYCLQEFELFLDFHREQEKAVGDISGYLRRASNRSAIAGRLRRRRGIPLIPKVKVPPLWKWAAAFLSIFIILVLAFVGIRSIFWAPDSRERGKLPGYVHLISPVRGEKAKRPLVFRWEGTPRAEYYQLEVFDSALLPLWKGPRVKELRYELPTETVDILEKNRVYFWMVKAWLTDGTSRESTLEEFTIRE